MRTRNWVFIGAAAVVVAIGAAAALYTGGGADAPPLAGAVQNFTVAEDRVPAPDTPLRTADGGTATLDRYRGKLVVLNFWATWCAPCVRELPSLQRRAQALPADGARVVLVSQDRGGFAQVTPFLDKLGVENADSYVDEKIALSRTLRIKGLPTTLLIDPDGDIVGRLEGHAEWDSPEAQALIRHYLK